MRSAPLLLLASILLSGCAFDPPGARAVDIAARPVYMEDDATTVEPFAVSRSAKASFAVHVIRGEVESCLVEGSSSRAWAGGERQDAWTCGSGNASRQLILARDQYFLGLRCAPGPCDLTFDLSVTPLDPS